MHAGSVDEHDLGPVLAFILRNLDNALNAVARGLRLGRNDRQLFAHERIEQGGLARVRAAENANETGAEWHGWVLGKSALSRVDLPALGRPRMQTKPERNGMVGS